MEPGDKTLGQIAFEAYAQQVQGVTYDNKPIPTWNNLTDAVRAGWEAAALSVTQSLATPNFDEFVIPSTGNSYRAGEAIDAGHYLTVRAGKMYRVDWEANEKVIGIATLHAETGEIVHGMYL